MDKEVVIAELREKRDTLKRMNASSEACTAIDRTHSFVEDYIEALFSPNFPNTKIPLFPMKLRY